MQVAQAKGLPSLKHHLLPRTKGFAVTVRSLRNVGKDDPAGPPAARERDPQHPEGSQGWRLAGYPWVAWVQAPSIGRAATALHDCTHTALNTHHVPRHHEPRAHACTPGQPCSLLLGTDAAGCGRRWVPRGSRARSAQVSGVVLLCAAFLARLWHQLPAPHPPTMIPVALSPEPWMAVGEDEA